MMASTSICTCSLDGAFGLGDELCIRGGPIGFADELTDGSGTLAVSGANVLPARKQLTMAILAGSLASPKCQKQAPLLLP